MADLNIEELGMLDVVGSDIERRMVSEIRRHRAAKAMPAVQLSTEEVDALEHLLRGGAAFAAIYPNGPDAVAAVAIRRLLAAHGAKP